MAGPVGPKVLATLLSLGTLMLAGVSAIQNDQTSSRSSQEDIILSASAYTGPERTSSAVHQDGLLTFQRTVPAFQLESSQSINFDKDEARQHERDTKHVEPIDELVSSKYIDHIDENNIEVKPGEYYRIVPTTSESISGEGQGAPQGRNLLSEPRQLVGDSNQRAQYLQAIDQPRQPRQEIPRSYSEHAPPPVVPTASAGSRQANPDIQDIITGIVKLLNGNVNVAANTARPLRPIQATRINNRGPPRISDVPPLPPDFDTPGMNPPPPPPSHPYPFEKPPLPDRPSINQLPPERPIRPFLEGVPLPEQIVPQGNRPWLWNRPGGLNRPIPPYKPLPPSLDAAFGQKGPNGEKSPDKGHFEGKPDATTTEVASTKKTNSNHRDGTADQGGVTRKPEEGEGLNEGTNATEESMPANSAPLNEKQVENKTTPTPAVRPGHSEHSINTKNLHSPKPVIPLEEEFEIRKSMKSSESKATSSSNSKLTKSGSKTPVKSYPATTLNIETSSSVQVIEPTATKTIIQPTAVPGIGNSNNSPKNPGTVILEPSRSSDYGNTEITSSALTPTDGLPTGYTKASSTHGKNTIRPVASSTYSRNPVPTDRYTYRPRPGIVLDDTLDYKEPHPTTRPYMSTRHPALGEVFDVTVSAIQGPGGGGGGKGVKVPLYSGGGDVILTSAVPGHKFVSIDGSRTYLDLFDDSDRITSTRVQPQLTRTQPPPITGTGLVIPQLDNTTRSSRPIGPPYHRTTHPPVRIDTCIVGDASTCDASQHEACATVQGVSACHCKPGYARLQHSLPCKRVVSIVVSIRVDKIYDRKVAWDRGLADKDSESYHSLSYEANRAIESAMSMTPFSDGYMGSLVNNVYQGDVSQGQGGVFVNATLKLIYEPRTVRPNLAGELQRHLLGVIQRRSNNIGKSALYVDSPPGSISNLQDLDECASSELNDCHSSASCTNNWGGFTCACKPGLKDPHKDDPNESGRMCLSCPSSYCNNRGACSFQNDQMQCTCSGNYYGTQCEVDGEVLRVAIGASVAALIVIILTLVCLIMWSRRWSREQKALGSPVYGYIQGGIPGTLPGTLARVGSVGTLASVKQGPPTTLPPYMWAHYGDHVATANIYATEPMGPTRPSSAVFGYPPLNVHGTLPPVPLPRLQAPPRPRQRHQPDPDSSDSELQDKDRADLIPQSSGFHVPRPKSRSSLANQSGIYNDVEYDQGDVHHLSKNNIPMSTYRPYYRT